MDDTIREYSGYFHFPALSGEQLAALRGLAAESVGTMADIGPTFLELNYTGRDSSRFVVMFLKQAAAVVGDALGEVLCQIDEDGVLAFEFYTIRSGQLLRQHGHIIRDEPVPVQ